MKTQKNSKKSHLDSMRQAAEKYGVKVIDMAERGIRAIGILGGVRGEDQEPSKDQPPTDSGAGAF